MLSANIFNHWIERLQPSDGKQPPSARDASVLAWFEHCSSELQRIDLQIPVANFGMRCNRAQMINTGQAWTHIVGAPVKDFFLVLRFLLVLVAAPLASECHARFLAFELFVPFFLGAAVSFIVLVWSPCSCSMPPQCSLL